MNFRDKGAEHAFAFVHYQLLSSLLVFLSVLIFNYRINFCVTLQIISLQQNRFQKQTIFHRSPVADSLTRIYLEPSIIIIFI